jgi:hypothetical protein
VSFMVFYERGFDMPLHQFLHSLLWYYSLEIHNLSPSGVLHIATFITLCEAYMGINPELDLWKYFFCVRHPQDPEVELTIFGGVVIHVNAGHAVYPYLEIPMPRSMKGWWKKLFYLKNDYSAPLPAFIVVTLFTCRPGENGRLGKTLASCNLCASPFSNCIFVVQQP